MNSYMQKKETVTRNWYVIDAEGKPLGRVASKAAVLLRGKHKPTYTPHIDCGDYVIIVNASKVLLTGNKLEDKKYYNHSQYPGGLRVRTAKEMVERYPEEMVEKAVKGMLPHNRLGRAMYKKLFVYRGENHPHMAQKPEEMDIYSDELSELGYEYNVDYGIWMMPIVKNLQHFKKWVESYPFYSNVQKEGVVLYEAA